MSTGPPPRYRVEFAKPALKEFQGLPREAQERIAPKINALAEDPRPHDDRLIVVVVRVADRRDVYRRKGN